MNDALCTVVIVASLAMAAWGLLWAALDRPPSRAQLAGLGVVTLTVLVLGISVLFTGGRPAETATFVGYLLTSLLLPPAAGALARMEPTRWGSLILGVGCLIIPVLVVRMQQVWNG